MISKIKEFIKRFSLVYRIGKSILERVDSMYTDLIMRINQLDAKMEYLFWLTQNSENEKMDTTKQKVFSSMPKAQGKDRLLQLANNAILMELKKVCDENDIEFFLAFGTLLGAVRNHGFIPWDDDVDVAVTRENYIKLVSVLKNNTTLEIDNYYSSMYQKFTKIKFKKSDKFFVDVFILDEFTADENNLAFRYNELKVANQSYVQDIREYFRETGKDVSSYNVPQLDSALNDRMNEKYYSLKKNLNYYGEGNYVCIGIDNPTFIRNMGYVYKKTDLFPATFVEFEGEMYSAFASWDAWLKNSYGNYWSLPKNITGGHNDLRNLSDEDFMVIKELGIIPTEVVKEAIKSTRKIDTLNTYF